MPKRRVQFTQGSYYHIYNRGADRRSIFRDTENYWFVLRLIKRYAASLQVSMIAYCLLPNHYHWLVRQDGEAPAGLLAQRVFNAYTKTYNNTYGRSGTLFEDRFKAIHVGSDTYLRHLCCYIHGNPVRHGLADAPEFWPYSNYLDWIGKRSGTLLDPDFVASQFGSIEQYQSRLHAHLTGQIRLPGGLQQYLAGL